MRYCPWNVDDEEEICVGIFRGVDNGENLEITGEYMEASKLWLSVQGK